MADNDNVQAAEADSRGFLGAIMEGAGKLWDFVTSDPALNAAGRQGIDEIGEALRPFPDSIQVSREVFDDGPPHPWPSELAEAARQQPDTGNSNVCQNDGADTGYSM